MWSNGWTDQKPLGKEIGLGPGHTVLGGDPLGTQPLTAAPPHFRPMPIVAKRSPISATAELLYSTIYKKNLASRNKNAINVLDSLTLSGLTGEVTTRAESAFLKKSEKRLHGRFVHVEL